MTLVTVNFGRIVPGHVEPRGRRPSGVRLDLFYQDLRDMRRVDDQLAAVGDNRLQLVKPLADVQMSSYLVYIIDSTRRYGGQGR